MLRCLMRRSGQSKLCKKTAPVFVAFCRIARLAAREQVAQSVSVPAKTRVLDRGKNVIPRLSGSTTVSAEKVLIWILAENGNGLSDALFVVVVARRDCRSKSVIKRRLSPRHDHVRLEMVPDCQVAHMFGAI